MIEYTVWTRGNFKDVIRREVMDTNTDSNGNGRWFTDADLNLYLDMWLQELQQEFEFTWAVSTLTVGTVTSTATYTQTNGTATNTYYSPPQLVISTATFTPAMLRNEAVYYNSFRLSGRNLQDLEVGDPIWRGDLGNGLPSPSDTNPYVYDIPRLAVMYPDSQSILIWPCPPPPGSIPPGTNTNVFVFEYPALLTFASDQAVSGLPVWTQWSAKSYVCQKLFQRPGPINDPKKAQRYAAQYQRARLRIRRLWDNYMPERFRRMIPSVTHRHNHYENDILCPPPAWFVGTNTAQDAVGEFTQYYIPSDGGQVVSLPIFFPFNNIQLFRNGLLQIDQNVDYTRIGTVLTFNFIPLPTDVMVAVVT